MREETRTVNRPVTKTVYIAKDGKEFDSKIRCIEHENKIRQAAAEERIFGLPHFELYAPGVGEFDDDPSWTWYKLSSDEDLEALKTALYCSDSAANETENLAVYPVWILAVVDDMGYGWIETYDDYVEEMRRHLSRLDTRIEEAEK